MLSFFRRAHASWFVLGLLGLVMVAFVITGVGTPGGLEQLASGGDRIAKVGNQALMATELSSRMQNQLDVARRENPQLDMIGFVRAGGFEQTLEQTISAKALHAFAEAQGMEVSRRAVDAKIAAIAAFAGPTGSFDRDTFLRVLADRKLTEAQVRSDFATDILTQRIIIPVGGAARMPQSVVLPYASLLLETRIGQVSAIPNALLLSKTPPTDAELSTFYTRNALRYTVPETRQIRYALFDKNRFAGKVTATDADIAAYYKANAATYAGGETRTVTQVIVSDQKAAQDMAAKIRSGTAIAAAAKAAGLVATTLDPKDRKEFTRLTSDAVAASVFSGKQGDVIEPGKSGLGWHVARIDAITATGGKSLEAARTEIATKLADTKIQEALADFVTKLEDEIADGATFDDVVKSNGLTVVSMPAVTAGGLAPGQPGFKVGEELQPVLTDAFKSEADDEPPVLSMGKDKEGKERGYAFYDLQSITPAAPKPLAQIRQQVEQDFIFDRAAKAARKLAETVAAKASGKTGLDQAMSGLPVRLPPPRPINARRLDLAQAQGRAPSALRMLFTLAPGKAKLVESDNNDGWYVVKLDNIQRGNAAERPDLIAATQGEMTQVLAEEYLSQFVEAVKADVGYKRNDDAIKRLRKTLTGSAGQ